MTQFLTNGSTTNPQAALLDAQAKAYTYATAAEQATKSAPLGTNRQAQEIERFTALANMWAGIAQALRA